MQSGLPSLILDLLTVSNGKYESNLVEKFDNLLNCEQSYMTLKRLLKQDPNFFTKSYCNFPGASIFRLMKEFREVNKRVDDYLYDVTIHKAWLTDYNVR